MNLKKYNLEYNLCIFLAVIINLGLFIFSETILSKILLLIAIVLLVIPNFMQKKKRKNS
ncbi:enterocin immunity protein [Enterococcus faecium UC7267]|nr:enterocin immunity protein [Enterococcus faecium UC7267]